MASRPDHGAAVWRKSSYSDGATNANCVEVAHRADQVAIRDSKRRSAGSLEISGASWDALLASARR